MTVLELSLLDSTVYVAETYQDISSLANSSILFNFTDSHGMEKSYDIYDVSMSNSMLFYRNNEPYWSLPMDDNMRKTIYFQILLQRKSNLSNERLFHGYDYKGTKDGWPVKHAEPVDIPNEKLFNYSVAVKIINRTMYPRYSPSLSHGLSGIIQQ